MKARSIHRVRAGVLEAAYESSGDGSAGTVVLLHGFPYDARAYDEVVPRLTEHGFEVVVPYLRGFGPTRFVDAGVQRSGQQGALGDDLLQLLDALRIDRAIVGGYDWGGRAACIGAALRPERIAGLVTVDGYNIQHLASATDPAPPEWESSYWYQYYFLTERGRRGLDENRDELCRLLWTTWSPTWRDATTLFADSKPSLHNPDFVDVVIHSYRHRHGAAAGDPRYGDIEEFLAGSPTIGVPTVVLESGADGVGGPSAAHDRAMFVGPLEYRHLDGIGHNVPQEAPEAFADAVLRVSALGR